MKVLGLKELTRDFERIKEAARGPEARKIFRREAGTIRDAVRREVPRGEGLLRRSIISFASKRRGARAEAAAFTRVNVLKGRVRAPHGHLVAFGTAERRPKRKKMLAFFSKRAGHVVFVRSVRPMRPNPYFERGLRNAGPGALQRALNDIGDLIAKT